MSTPHCQLLAIFVCSFVMIFLNSSSSVGDLIVNVNNVVASIMYVLFILHLIVYVGQEGKVVIVSEV